MKTEQRKNIFQAVILLAVVGVLFLNALYWRTQKQAAGQGEVTGPSEEAGGKDMFCLSEVLGSCVRIQAEGHHGSGSIYRFLEDEIIIATNYHVLQYWNEDSYVTFFNGAVGNGSIVTISEQEDVGFLCVQTAFLSAEELEGLHAVNGSESSLTRGDTLYMVDIASDVWQPEVYEGQVLEPCRYLEEFQTEMLYGESLFKPGMSGCGVFDREGNYVGMLTAGTDQNEIAAVTSNTINEIFHNKNQFT